MEHVLSRVKMQMSSRLDERRYQAPLEVSVIEGSILIINLILSRKLACVNRSHRNVNGDVQFLPVFHNTDIDACGVNANFIRLFKYLDIDSVSLR